MAKTKIISKEQFIEDETEKFIKVIKGTDEQIETPKDILLTDLDTQENIDNFVRGIIPENFAKDYKKLKKLQDEIEKTEKSIKEKLLKMFEEHPEMEDKHVSMDGLKFSYTKSYTKKSVDSKKLEEEYPEIYKKVLKTSNVKSSIKTYIEY